MQSTNNIFMPVILHIETSTNVCSITLSENGKILFEKIDVQGQNHSKVLGIFAKDILNNAKNDNKTIDAIAISCGPGSYTGLRIGVSFAKGLCYGLNVPLIAINTLKLMAYGFLVEENPEKGSLLCPMIDARRMEVYSAFFNTNLEEIRPTSADIIDESSYVDLLQKRVYFFGNGSEKCKTQITHPNAYFVSEKTPLSKYMISLAEKDFEKYNFKDTAYFEPFYLKEFIASTPKNKVF